MANILVFKIGAECLGIETVYVRSITKDSEWVNKHFKDAANGIVECNGRKMFLMNFSEKNDGRCHGVHCIAASFNGNECLIPIDEMIDIFQVSQKDIAPIPPFAERNMSKNFFKGVLSIDSKLILILDMSKF